MNLFVLSRTRRHPQIGDVFAMLPPDGEYLFGRVIETNANPLGVGGAVLIYIYQARSASKRPVPQLSPDELLLPPMMTNKQPWTRGYFEHLENRPLTASARLPRHCFRDTRGRFHDEMGNRQTEATGPVGQWGLHSYQTLDDEISKALGIPLASAD